MSREEFVSMLDEERAERYALLLKAPCLASANLEGLPDSVDQCRSFDMCSVNSQMIKPYGSMMNEMAIERIIRFVADDDMRMTTRVCRLILPIIDAFFQFFHLTHNRTTEQLLQLKYDGMNWSRKYFELYQKQTERFLNNLFTKVSTRLNTHEREVLMIFKGIGKHGGSPDRYLSLAINFEVIRPATRETIKESMNDILESIRSTTELTREYIMNEILVGALGQQEISDFAAMLLDNRINGIAITANILYMVNTFAAPTITCAKTLEIKTEEVVKLLFNKFNDQLANKLLSASKLRYLAQRCISMIKERLEEQKVTMYRAVALAGTHQREVLESLMEQTYSLASPQLVLQQGTLDRTEIHTPRFIAIECELCAAQDMARFPGQTPELRWEQNQSTIFSIFAADWGDEKDLIVKKLTQHIPDQPYVAYYEAHYHLQVAKLQHPSIINLRYLYNHRLDDGSSELWMIFPALPLTLQQVLNDNATLISMEKALQWMIRVADALTVLHENERAHRNVTLNNIVLNEYGQAYLMDFGDWNDDGDFSLRHHPSFTADRFNDDIRALGHVGRILIDFIKGNEQNSAIIFEFTELMSDCVLASDEKLIEADFMDFSHDDAIRASLLFSQHLKTNINRAVKDFQQQHRAFHEIISRSDHTDLQEIISTFFTHLSLSEREDLESTSTTILDDYQTSDRPALVVFGPNSSGKTSFLQRFLSIGNILPSGIGPVTARIVHLSYASHEQASFYVYDTIEQNSIKHHESLASFFVNRREPDWSGISQCLSSHLKRPANISANSSEFSEWSKSLVEIRLPSNILQLGIDLYDTPGFLYEQREEVLIANLYQLVKRIRPTLLFLYENATINETERSCFLAMKNAVNGLECVPVFFLNTKADCISIANDFMLDDDPDNVPNNVFEEILLEKRQCCYNLLLKREEMANEVLGELPPSIEQCTCFDICTTPPDYDPWEQYTALINSGSFRRIVRFAVETFSMPALATANDLLAMVDKYFDLLATTTPRPAEQWIMLRDEALKWGEEFFAEFTELMPTLAEELMGNIQGLFEHLKGPIAQRAAAIERHDDPIDQLLEDNAKSIRQYLQLAVREPIIKVAENKTIVQQRDNIRQKIGVHFQRQKGMRKNELLTLAQRIVLTEINVDVLENTTWFNSVLDGIMKLKMKISRYFCSLPSQWRSLVREKLSRLSESETPTIDDDDDVFTLLDAMDAYATLSNEKNRRLFADSCLTKLAEEILQRKKTFARNLTTWVYQEQQMFIRTVNEIHGYVSGCFSRISNSNNLLEKFSSPLARIECQLLAVMEMSKRNGIAPTIDSPIGQGGFYSVHAAHWNDERNLAVKKLLQRSTEHEQMMASEIHYHRAATRFCSEYVAPLLYVYENPLPDNQREFWIIMPRYRQSLQEYLKAHITRLSFEQCINWALTIGQAVAQLHCFDFTHRDLKSSNVMIDDNQRCYLIDFGTVKVGLCNRTILGTPTLAPEMLTDGPVSYDGTAVDIYCFGLLLYELLPKTTYDRLDRAKLSHLQDLLKSNPKCDESTKDYERLMLDCLQNKPTSRPRADVIVSRLKEIQKRAEVKLCTVCEEHERALRFVPCQHKVMCEACWQSWSERFPAEPKCIVCETVVRGCTRDIDNATFIAQ